MDLAHPLEKVFQLSFVQTEKPQGALTDCLAPGSYLQQGRQNIVIKQQLHFPGNSRKKIQPGVPVLQIKAAGSPLGVQNTGAPGDQRQPGEPVLPGQAPFLEAFPEALQQVFILVQRQLQHCGGGGGGDSSSVGPNPPVMIMKRERLRPRARVS